MPSPNQDPFTLITDHAEDISATLEDVRVYFDDVEILTTAYERPEDDFDEHTAYLRAEIQEKASWLLLPRIDFIDKRQNRGGRHATAFCSHMARNAGDRVSMAK